MPLNDKLFSKKKKENIVFMTEYNFLVTREYKT